MSSLPKPANSEVQLTVAVAPLPVIVQTGSPFRVKCAPSCASAGTAAKAVTSSDSTAIMPNFLNIKVFLLYLVGLYCSLRTGACLRHCLRAVECLFAGAGRSCKDVHSQNKCPAPCRLMTSSKANLVSSPPFPYTPKQKQNRLTSHLGGSRLRYWLCPSLKRPLLGRASKPLHFGPVV